MNSRPTKPDTESRFSTFDLGLAAALVTLGHDLAEIDKTNRAKARFVFVRQTTISADVESYWRGDLVMSARYLLEAQKMIKNRLYSD
jgi:hypothetical protein